MSDGCRLFWLFLCCWIFVKVKVTLQLMVSQSVSMSWNRAPSGSHDQIFITYVTVMVWGALSDERTLLSFLCAAGPCQHSLSRVRVPWDSRPYFTVSDLRHPFLSPPTTRRVTVEVFYPASAWVIFVFVLYEEIFSSSGHCSDLLLWMGWVL
jgi:hypothetical protein